MKYLLLLVIISCASNKKNNNKDYKINQCLYYKGYNVMIIDKDLDNYTLYYDFGNEQYVARETVHYIKTRMIPINCTDSFIKKMNIFIKEMYSK